MDEEIRSLLWLIMVLGAGNTRIWTLLKQFQTPQRTAEMLSQSQVQEKLNLPPSTLRRIRQTKAPQVEEMLTRCEKAEISILWYGDAAYPEQLLSIVNPPVLLFYQGDLSLLRDHLLLTIVGTRSITEYSLHVEKTICSDLVQLGFVPVTGFAVGADITANLCALQMQKPSVALMGCGLDVPYPSAHHQLKRDIAACGLILSEFLPGTSPIAANFPLRNRVLSGLSMGTMVIQAPTRSGSLITAECALEQGRDVFCVPPADIFDKQYMGVIKYLRDGAIPVFDSRDVIYEYYTRHAHLIDGSALYDENRDKTESFVMSLGEEQTSTRSRKPSRARRAPAAEAEAEAKLEPVPEDAPEAAALDDAMLSELQRDIVALLRKQKVMHVDMIAAGLDAPADRLVTELTELELMGCIERLPGKQFRII